MFTYWNLYFDRVPGNNAMVTALEEELNAKTPDDINFDEPVWTHIVVCETIWELLLTLHLMYIPISLSIPRKI